MLTIANIQDIDPAKYDQVWIIMRHITSVNPMVKYQPNVIWVPELSPSDDLFAWTQKRKRNFHFSEEIFQNFYVPAFLQEMHEKEAVTALNRLFLACKAKNIAIGCSCSTEKMCHRSIIAGLMSGAGITCQNEYGKSMQSYNHFFTQYKGETYT